MRKPIVGVAIWLLCQLPAAAQIPEAPGHGGRDEQPDEIQAPLPAHAPPVPTVPSKKQSAHDTVETMQKARANAAAEASATPTESPKPRKRHHKHSPPDPAR